MHMYHQMMQQQGMMPNRGIMQQNHPSQAARAPTETPKESADKGEQKGHKELSTLGSHVNRRRAKTGPCRYSSWRVPYAWRFF